MILGIPSGESYSGIRALADLSVCVNLYQQASWRRYWGNGCWINFEPSLTFYFTFSFSMDSTLIYQYAKPTSASLEPPKSSEPILTPGYELCPCFIKLIRDKSFLGEGNKKPILTPTRVWTDLCMLAYRWHVWQNLKMKVIPVLFDGKN